MGKALRKIRLTQALAAVVFVFDPADSSFWIASDRLALHLDREMRYEAFSLEGPVALPPAGGEPAGGLAVMRPLDELGPAESPETITIGSQEVGDFTVADPAADATFASIASPWFGGGGRLTLRGRSATRAIEKTLVVELYDAHDDAAVLRASFRNLGVAPLAVTRLRQARCVLDMRRADPARPPYGFLAVQPTIDAWGQNWIGVALGPGYTRDNRLIGGTVLGRGGMPFMDLWGPSTGMALASLEPRPTALHLPCAVRADNRVEMGVEVRPLLSHGQWKSSLAPGASMVGPRIALIAHRGDFYDAACRYGRLLEASLAESGRETFGPWADAAYVPYWKTWGLGFDFTVDEVYARLDQLADLGFGCVALDDGWFDTYGGWDPHPAKFPGGESDLVALLNDLHAAAWGAAGDRAFEAMLWWDPVAWQSASGLPQSWCVRDASGGYPLDSRGHRYLCPAYAPAVAAMTAMVDRMLGEWGADALYMDTDGLLGVPPCYNPAHGHTRAAQSAEKMPDLYQAIEAAARRWKPDGFLVTCECSAPHDPYKMAYYDQEDASDPITDRMVRWKVKFSKALRGADAPVGDGYVDPMPFNDLSGTFAYGFGAGAVLTSMHASLDALGAANWNTWSALNAMEGASRAEVVNVYNLGFEFPEGHALRRDDGVMFFTFASDLAWSGQVELRGLEPGTSYEVRELDTGALVAMAAGPEAAVAVTMRRQGAGMPYWIVLEATPGMTTAVAEGRAARGGERGTLRVSPVPSAGPVAIFAPGVSPGAPSRLEIFDVRGRMVRELQARGERIFWDGRDASGAPVPAGLYLVRLLDGSYLSARALIVR